MAENWNELAELLTKRADNSAANGDVESEKAVLFRRG